MLSSAVFLPWPVIPACWISKTPCMPLILSLPHNNHTDIQFSLSFLQVFSSLTLGRGSPWTPHVHLCIPACCGDGSSAAFPEHMALLCTSLIISAALCYSFIPVQSHPPRHHLCLEAFLLSNLIHCILLPPLDIFVSCFCTNIGAVLKALSIMSLSYLINSLFLQTSFLPRSST